MLRKIIIILITLSILLFQFTYINGEVFQNEELYIECDPTEITLKPDKVKTTTITNLFNETEKISVNWIATESFGFTQASFNGDDFGGTESLFFKLEPAKTKQIKLYLKGSNEPPQSKGAEDGVIEIIWGTDLSNHTWGTVDRTTMDNYTYIGINIHKEGHNIFGIDKDLYQVLIIVIALIVIIVITLFIRYLYKSKKKES